jgi:hypothetical protein
MAHKLWIRFHLMGSCKAYVLHEWPKQSPQHHNHLIQINQPSVSGGWCVCVSAKMNPWGLHVIGAETN